MTDLLPMELTGFWDRALGTGSGLDDYEDVLSLAFKAAAGYTQQHQFALWNESAKDLNETEALQAEKEDEQRTPAAVIPDENIQTAEKEDEPSIQEEKSAPEKQPKKKLPQHLERINEGGIFCKYCGEWFASAKDVRRHRNAVHYRTKKCRLCNFASHADSLLDLHYKSRHTNIRDQHCPHCDFSTPYPYSLDCHIKTVHSGIKDRVCEMCGYATAHPHALAVHIQSAHSAERSMHCPHESCPYAAYTKQALRSHVRAVHDKVKDKVCDVCGYATMHAHALRGHLMSKHGVVAAKNSGGRGRVARKRELKNCDLCSYSTLYDGCLMRHKAKQHQDLVN